jgi:hypothetical protein
MRIDEDLVVKIGDGTLTFDEPSLRDWAVLTDLQGKSLVEQADILVPKLKAIEGFEYADGAPVTLQDIQDKKFSARFFFQIVRGWTEAMLAGMAQEAASKNEPTLN